MPVQSADFWNDRFSEEQYVYGIQPNSFVRSAAETWLPEGRDVLTLGAGEGRNAVYLAQQGHAVTAVDYSAEGLRKTQKLAAEAGVDIETIRADVRDWSPERQWNGVVVTFLHLLPAEREALSERIQRLLRPGGLLVAEWFRPEQLTEDYDSGGPPFADLMVTMKELREQFPNDGIERLTSEEPHLDEGRHQGPAATVRFVWKRS